jgi:hypothetical protein
MASGDAEAPASAEKDGEGATAAKSEDKVPVTELVELVFYSSQFNVAVNILYFQSFANSRGFHMVIGRKTNAIQVTTNTVLSLFFDNILLKSDSDTP